MPGWLAGLGSAVFFFLAPCVVAGLVPWLLTGWDVATTGPFSVVLRVIGGFLTLGAAAVLTKAFVRFAQEGRGTPAPLAPTEILVVNGSYRYIRNPMYVAVVSVVLGQAAFFGQLVLVAYSAVLLAVFAAFVHWYEEPALRRQFGAQYDAYRQAVPAWRPRVRPWQGPPTGT